MEDQRAVSIENLQEAISQNNVKFKAWVNSLVGTIKVVEIKWVDTLPVDDISTSTIYMVKSETSTTEKNLYNEYVYKEDSGWEILGQVDAASVKLDDYYTKEEIDSLLENVAGSVESYTAEEITSMIASIWGE